jgi:hypothetical protein
MSGADETYEPVCNDGDTYLPNPEDPTTFYQCVDGVPHLHDCTEGTIFDPSITPGPVCAMPQDVTPYWPDHVRVPGLS